MAPYQHDDTCQRASGHFKTCAQVVANGDVCAKQTLRRPSLDPSTHLLAKQKFHPLLIILYDTHVHAMRKYHIEDPERMYQTSPEHVRLDCYLRAIQGFARRKYVVSPP